MYGSASHPLCGTDFCVSPSSSGVPTLVASRLYLAAIKYPTAARQRYHGCSSTGVGINRTRARTSGSKQNVIRCAVRRGCLHCTASTRNSPPESTVVTPKDITESPVELARWPPGATSLVVMLGREVGRVLFARDGLKCRKPWERRRS
jgi:hypothetical protein